MSDFKKCPNGHYYQGDHCPYCKIQKKTNNQSKVCSNHHAYDSELKICPICNSTIVVDEYDLGHDTIVRHTIRLITPQIVKVDNQFYSGISHIYVYISRGYKLGYAFSKGGWDNDEEDDIKIEPEVEIQIGETIVKGKELMKMCDLIIDNQVSFMVHYRFTTTIDVVTDNLNPV